jgi:hypothetical protein
MEFHGALWPWFIILRAILTFVVTLVARSHK